MVHPSEVCRVIALFALSLTPSMISISPSSGQLGPSSQNAGLTKMSAEGSAAKTKDARKDKPCATNSAWHVRDIKGEQTVGVGCIARDAHAVSAGSVGNMSAVDTHVDKAIIGVDIAVLGCCVLIDIVHITSSGIG